MIREVNVLTGKVREREYTEEEVANNLAAVLRDTPTLEAAWEASMLSSDVEMPRILEDIIDALDMATRARIALETLTKYNNKKQLRASKPV